MSLPPLPARPADGHKGTFGTVLVIGGQATQPRLMVGGPALAALGALRAGAGLAVLAVPEPIAAAAITIAPSATALPLPVDRDDALDGRAAVVAIEAILPDVDVVAIGPGFGTGAGQAAVLASVLGQSRVPVVADADALNVMASDATSARAHVAPLVVTPHPGEYRRLATAMGLDQDPVHPQERPEAARALAEALDAIVVLKGHRTVVADASVTWIGDTGNVALATGGTGDVLTGVIAGLAAQFLTPPGGAGPSWRVLSLRDCAAIGVRVHGRAADAWASRHGGAGLVATDLASLIPDALSER